MFCGKCGNILSPEEKFCGKCGASVASRTVAQNLSYTPKEYVGIQNKKYSNKPFKRCAWAGLIAVILLQIISAIQGGIDLIASDKFFDPATLTYTVPYIVYGLIVHTIPDILRVCAYFGTFALFFFRYPVEHRKLAWPSIGVPFAIRLVSDTVSSFIFSCSYAEFLKGNIQLHAILSTIAPVLFSIITGVLSYFILSSFYKKIDALFSNTQ